MQKGRRAQGIQDSVSKPVLLGLITVLVIAVVAPIIMPHIAHPSMIYHIVLHIASLTIAVFLSVVSLLAFRRNAGARLVFMTFGFMSLAAVEFLYLLEASDVLIVFNLSTLGIELPHVILLAMLASFGLGVLKVNK